MRAGQLNQIIELQQPIKTVNNYGEAVIEYATKYKMKAQVKYNNGSRNDNGAEIFNSQQVQFMVRNCWDIKEDMRILYKGKYYQISYIDSYNDRLVIKGDRINE